MHGWLQGYGNAEEMIRHLLKSLLINDVVDGLLVPLRTPDGRNVVPTLIHDPGLLAQAAPTNRHRSSSQMPVVHPRQR